MAPLKCITIVGYPNDMHDAFYQSALLKYQGNNAIPLEEHIEFFSYFLEDFNVTHKNVKMRLYVHFLKRDGRRWFTGSLNNSITSLDAFTTKFKEYWGEKKD
jgi:hypothetical protein